MSKPVILTGLRANNDLHIGNYFGALLPLIDMAKNRADDFEINLFVPDLHSFTTPIDHSQLHGQIMHNLRLFAAAGLPLDHPNIHVYRQSYVPAHSELTWILDCFTGFGEMRRMTQFKDKSGLQDIKSAVGEQLEQVFKSQHETFPDIVSDEKKIEYLLERSEQHYDFLDKLIDDWQREDRVSVGLFNYPVLMACDILLYGASYVPVGDDQSQHLEFARDIAERLNNKFGELFTVPKPVKEQHEFFGKDQGLRIKDLQDPTKKMSKSDETGKGIIFMGDNPEEAAKKVMGATTDSVGIVHYDMEKQPGISNLLQIHALLAGEPLQAVIDKHDGQQSYGDLKKEVAEQVKEFLADFQGRLASVDETALMAKLEADEKQMNDIANATLLNVQKAVGLRA
ncbi:MAG TPA: tryptophan--tRNA ligase [Candidatus Saccharimonadales bacterium]|nr:tryptophan--tRNA ligase [Candidatus Saccharimonadales bacterium]